MIQDDDLEAPAVLAATTLLSVCLLFDEVHTSDELLLVAGRFLYRAMRSVETRVGHEDA